MWEGNRRFKWTSQLWIIFVLATCVASQTVEANSSAPVPTDANQLNNRTLEPSSTATTLSSMEMTTGTQELITVSKQSTEFSNTSATTSNTTTKAKQHVIRSVGRRVFEDQENQTTTESRSTTEAKKVKHLPIWIPLLVA